MRTLRLVTTLAVASLLAGAVAAVAATPASAATAVFSVTNNWGNGYQGQVTVTNDTSAPITSWRVEFDLPSSSTVSQSWNAQQTTSGSHYTFANVSWNGTLAAGASTSFGFLVNGTGTPVNCTVNGASCAGGPPPTTPPPTTPPPTTPPPTTGTPVERHGQLRVCGTTMCDKSGARVQLRGISSMWLNWETAPYAENLSALTWMRDNWNLQVIRAAMGVEPAGAYLSDPSKARAQVETIVNNAVTAGVYVIVDWHAHEAQNNQSQAVAFFGDLARRYGHLPNVIWEPYNEPLQVSWTNVIKPYHQAVVSAIRAADPDNIVVLGTPTWSQDVDVAAASPVSGTNLMYTLHFYSCTHGASLRAKGDAAIRAGLALFVTEWGASNADGGLDGRACLPEAQSWVDWMKANGISWTAWKLDVGTDTTNLLSPGAPVTGGWTNYLHGHAPFVVANMR
ncbi:cellulase family glycosylhydrolase [Micromonospora sp. NBC_00362]|uniref:cellulase family glycosylhydrolase n=1 Tax=Micromonospora sp. NBC_00362 TaxID=2975975 RepID=UPI00225A59DA|nr:cellulase family glycosylhydrolase [Micromonospora sp. NBC_00362]MCX5116118.1 cellulase family glycosylhydrolase [Micromonospora sp. NBC_00362]